MSSVKTVGILGGGISGLSTAYYLRKKFGDLVKPVILEKSSRFGGWIKTISRTDGDDVINYEVGPRTIRPAGVSGMNTLDLIEELDLGTNVLYVQKDHPAAKTRFIYTGGKLVKLPTDMKVLFKKQEPFDGPLIFSGLRDLFKWRKKTEDDSIYNFVQRRFGNDVATYVIDPMIRGICAGDSRNISVKFLMKTLFEYEQKYGSVALGFLLSRFFGKKDILTSEEEGVGFSNIALASLRENWAVWTLQGGLQTLPWKLADNLEKQSVQMINNCTVKAVKLGDRAKPDDHIEVEYYCNNDEKTVETLVCNHVISTIPTNEFGKILRRSKPSHPSLWKVFETMGSTDVQVTNLMYRNPDILEHTAFGFLVPSVEKSVNGFLGVVFDTCSFPQAGKTVLTVMSKPGVDKEHDLTAIREFLKTALNITAIPDDHYSEYLSNCIPQYTIGHYEKVEAVRRFLKAAKLPLTLAGASYDGVSVNDCIFSGRKAAEEAGKVHDEIKE